MLKFLWRLLVVGFPPKCQHEFEMWQPYKSASDGYGVVKIYQSRGCKKCGFTELDCRTVG